MTAKVEHKAIQGVRQRMLTQARASGALVDLVNTQLISARLDVPRQFIITMAQATIPNGTTPWEQNWDGAAAIGSVFTAPGIPTISLSSVTLAFQLQCIMRWAAGGVSYETRFDYPVAGGSFGVTADQLDLNVFIRPGQQLGIEPEIVPVIGAWMVEGQAADPTPMRWAERPIIANAASTHYWSVKPYARKLHIVAPLTTLITGQFFAVSGIGATVGLREFRAQEPTAGAGVDTFVDVPAGAEIVSIVNSGSAASTIYAEWHMGFV